MAERSSKRSSSAPISKKECAIAEPADTMSHLNLSPEDIPECAVCLQSCMHPVKLPCSHIFCFLCVKGAANQSRRCALCRQAIPTEYFNNPTLVSKKDNLTKGPDEAAETEHYSWYYEGRNGWWQYDERTNVELEESYNAKKRTFELLIAGYMYVIDLDNMVQMRRNDPSRRRRIKRDLVSAPKKGIAGLKIAAQPEGSAAMTEEQQAAAPETVGSAVAAGGAFPQQSGAAPKPKSGYGSDHTKSRTAGVGKDTGNVNLSSVSADQYDADDDYDGTDDEDDDDVQWLGSNRRPAQRSRQERRAGSSHYARVTHDNRSGLEAAQSSLSSSRQHTSSGTRSNPQGLPIRHQRVSSAPETRSGSYDQSTATHSRSVHPDSQDVDQQALEHADTSGVDSAMHSLHLSTPDETVYELTTVPSQSSQGEVRQRRRRQQQNSDVAL